LPGVVGRCIHQFGSSNDLCPLFGRDLNHSIRGLACKIFEFLDSFDTLYDLFVFSEKIDWVGDPEEVLESFVEGRQIWLDLFERKLDGVFGHINNYRISIIF
jgi:hypothetical protein